MVRVYKSVNILGLSIHKLTIQDVVGEVETALNNQTTLTITALNPDKINQTLRQPSLRAMYGRFNIVAPDSIGVLLAARILRKPLMGERIGGDVLAPHLYEMARRRSIKFYFLGGKENIAKQAANKIIQAYPWLNIVGVHNGYFDQNENTHIIRQINQLSPNIVFVGLGAPLENIWIVSNATRIKPCVLITMGGYFDHVLRRIDCYPKWVSYLKVNWLYRLCSEPKRLWRRYLVGNPLFLLRILKHHLFNSTNSPQENAI
jgi:exopolysaccharide biosynthesis WecB/TagA/CpsF family protein